MFNDEQFDCEHSRVTATTKDMIEVLHLGVYYNSTSVCIVKHLYTTNFCWLHVIDITLFKKMVYSFCWSVANRILLYIECMLTSIC